MEELVSVKTIFFLRMCLFRIVAISWKKERKRERGKRLTEKGKMKFAIVYYFGK